MFTIADVMSRASQVGFANSAAVLCDLGGTKAFERKVREEIC
jgi:hypothetical protein